MTEDAKAACRAALLKACEQFVVGSWTRGAESIIAVDVDDAAACMARAIRAAVDSISIELWDVSATQVMQEIALRAALAPAQEPTAEPTPGEGSQVIDLMEALKQALKDAALAAAQENPDGR